MIQTAIKTLLIVGACFWGVQPGLSQGLEFQNYAITQFGMEDGLPQSTVTDIIQTKDGYIWLATLGGLVRFDGNSFTTYNRSNTPGMDSDRILKLFGDSDGGIWLFPEDSESILYRFKDGKNTKLPVGDTPIATLGIYEDEEGMVWVRADEMVLQYTGENLKRISITKDPEVVEQVLNDPGGIWIGNESDVLKTSGNRVAHVFDTFSVSNSRIVEVIEHPKHSERLIIGTSMGGVLEMGKNGDLISSHKLPYGYFLNFKIDNDKTIFGLTAGGIIFLDNGSFKVFDPPNLDDKMRLRSILQDNEGNYWVGTDGDGLFKLRKTIITMIDMEDGLDNEKMLSLTKLEDGTMLFSTNCGGVFEWKNNRATLSSVQSFYHSACNWSVFQDSRNRIWIGGANPYVTSALDEPGQEFGVEDGYTGFTVFAMMEDSNGQVWITTANGIFVYNDGFIEKYTSEDGLYVDHASSLFEDEDGVIWVGTKGGLNAIQNGKVTKIELRPDSSGENEIKQPWVRAIHEDKDGVMWFGTYGHGLFSLKNGVITNISVQSGLYDNIISHIVEDKNGNFWMGSNRGISRVHRKDLLQFIEGEIESVRSYSYGTAEGMNSAETNGGFQPNTVTDSLGNIYFPTVAGVAVVSTNEVKRNEIPPPVFIEQIKNNEAEIPISSSISLPYDNPYLEINYTALSFTAPKKVQFKYRMTGLSNDWIDAGNRRTALYSKIPPGDYTFEVIASNNDGVWNTEGASMAVSVIPPFWQTRWFYTLLFILFISTGPAIYYVRINTLRRENERQKRFTEQLIESQENERRRIAADLHDGLGQQILVIKNRAELAQNQIHDPEGIAEQLKEITQSAVSSIGDVRSISHALRPVHLEKFGLTEALNNLCDQLQDISPPEWSYYIDDIDGIIPKDKEINFYRVLQEGIKNVMKHSEAEQASVMVRKTKSAINTVLWDDGKGFDIKKQHSFGGLGFLGMNERIETIGGTIDIDSAPGKGTVIKIIIPIQQDG